MKTDPLLLGVVFLATLLAGFVSSSRLAPAYRQAFDHQASKLPPVGFRDPVLAEMKARMFGAGYEAGRGVDPENKPTREAIFERSRAAASELNVLPRHLEVCLDRFKEGFLAGMSEAENEATHRHHGEPAGL